MKSGLNRSGTECFYTDERVSAYLVKKINELYKLSEFDEIVEPSAGTGSFLKELLKYKKEILAFDIDPKFSGISKADFLLTDIQRGKKTLVVGNPPFGKNSCLASKFIKKSCEFASVIAFILPKSYKKNSKIRDFDIFFHLVYLEDIPKNSFRIENEIIDVPCSFFIYEKKAYNRAVAPIVKPNNTFFFIKKSEISDYSSAIAFKRVGGNAGMIIKTDLEKLSEQSHYFFVCSSEFDFSKLKFEINNTVGPRSISKQELISELNKLT